MEKMGTAFLLKLVHAAFLFFKEMWLRDRTFRQFVREHLALIVMGFGFVVMSGMFFNLYVIVKDQESAIAIKDSDIKHLSTQLSTLQEDYRRLSGSADFWRDKYIELKDQKKPVPSEPAKPVQPPAVPKQPTPEKVPEPSPTPANRGPSTSLVDRWKRLHP